MDRNRPPVKTLVLRYGLLLIPLGFLSIFFFYPLGSVLHLGFVNSGTLDISAFIEIASSRYYQKTLWFTTWQAVLSTLLTVVLALPGAYVFTRYQFPGRSFLLSLSTLPFVLPTVVVGAAFTALLGPNGTLNQILMSVLNLNTPPIQLIRTLPIILIAHVFYNYAVALRIIAAYWSSQSTYMEDAARVLGCPEWRLWLEIRLPILRPALSAASILVFIFTFTSFGVILILGGPQYATLEVEIQYQAIALFDLEMASALSVVQIVLMFLLTIVYTRLQRNLSLDQQSSIYLRRPKNNGERLLVIGVTSSMILLLFAPLAALVIQAFNVNGQPGLDYFIALTQNDRRSINFVAPINTIANSLRFATITTILAVLLGTLTAFLLAQRKSRLMRLLDPIFMLPLAASAVTLGFGFLIALDEPPLNFRASPLLIPLAHTLVAMPFVVRSILPGLSSIPQSYREAAMVLGASPIAVLRWIDLPLVSRGIIVGMVFAFTISLGEFGASLFIARPGSETMPIVIARLLGRPGQYGEAVALSTILMSVCAAGFLLIERIRTDRLEAF